MSGEYRLAGVPRRAAGLSIGICWLSCLLSEAPGNRLLGNVDSNEYASCASPG